MRVFLSVFCVCNESSILQPLIWVLRSSLTKINHHSIRHQSHPNYQSVMQLKYRQMFSTTPCCTKTPFRAQNIPFWCGMQRQNKRMSEIMINYTIDRALSVGKGVEKGGWWFWCTAQNIDLTTYSCFDGKCRAIGPFCLVTSMFISAPRSFHSRARPGSLVTEAEAAFMKH